MAKQNSVSRIIVKINSQLVVNSINGTIRIPKDIANLAEDVECLLTHFNESIIEYCNRVTNRDVDALAKRVHL